MRSRNAPPGHICFAFLVVLTMLWWGVTCEAVEVAGMTATGIRIAGDPEIEGELAALGSAVDESIDSAVSCFVSLGFDVDRALVLRKAVFFADGDSARRQIAEHFGMKPEDVPRTFGGTVDGATLFVSSPAAYEGSFTTLYGEGSWSPDEYRKLLVHEIAHRVHALLATGLYGSEDGMGPRWFFEGVAIDCAGQFASEQPPQVPPAWETLADLIARAEADELEVPFYPRFAWLFRSLAARVDTGWMIRHAADKDFVDQVRVRYEMAIER